jgi:hypothetical protein
MVEDPSTESMAMDRRRFLFLAGAGAAVGAVILATTTPRKLLQTLTTPTQSANPAATSATAGKRIWTPLQQTGASFLSRLFGKPL